MNKSILPRSTEPIVCISGLGGSGTRVYAEIIKQAGIDIGADINPQNDNLLFTRLFKDPEWYKSFNKAHFKNRLDLFLHLSRGLQLTMEQEQTLNQIFEQNQCFKTKTPYDFSKLVRNLSSEYGWKEPNSHVYLKELGESLLSCKFIFIIRDGPEMSLSKNTQQLKNWGKALYNLKSQVGDKNIPLQQLKYWFLTSQRAIEIGNSYLEGRFLVLKFKDIYTNPAVEIKKIANFLDIEMTSEQISLLSAIPQKPASAGRYNHNFLNLDKTSLEIINKTNEGIAVSKDEHNHLLEIPLPEANVFSLAPNTKHTWTKDA